MSGRDLPLLNAFLNAVACVLLCAGLLLIHRGKRRAHAAVMIGATLTSAVFLVSYCIYHFAVLPEVGHTPFRRQGWVRTLYYALLLSHVFLAVVQLPLIAITLWRAARRDWSRHRRIARITWPIWFYVSVTGVIVYLALYHWNPPAE